MGDKKKQLSAKEARKTVELQAALIADVGKALLEQKTNFERVCALQQNKLIRAKEESINVKTELAVTCAKFIKLNEESVDLRLRVEKYESEGIFAFLKRYITRFKSSVSNAYREVKAALPRKGVDEEFEYFWDPEAFGGMGCEVKKPKRR